MGYPVGTPVVRNTSSNIITGLGYRLVNPSSPYDILVLENGKYFTDSGIRTFTVQRSVVNNVTTWNYVSNKANWTLQLLQYKQQCPEYAELLPPDNKTGI